MTTLAHNRTINAVALGLAVFFLGAIEAKAEPQPETKTVRVTAYGKSCNDALKAGLLEAIGRVTGRMMEANEELNSFFTTSVENKKEDFRGVEDLKSHTNFTTSVENKKEDFRGAEDLKLHTKSLSRGLVKEYEVIRQEEKNTNEWVVELSVTVATKVPQEYAGRKRVVVLPFGYNFEINRKIFSINGQEGYGAAVQAVMTGVNNQHFSGLFENNLEANLVQTRKFMVLDRRHAEEVGREQGVALTGAASLEDLMKITQEIPADLIVVGALENVSYVRKTVTMPSGKNVEYGEGSVHMNFRVIDVKTRQIKYADSVAKTFSDNEIWADGSPDVTSAGNMLMAWAADQIGEQIQNAIYPIRVIGFPTSDSVTLNQGGRGVNKDCLFDVFKLGEEMVDPYTKESLGCEEIYAGLVKITDVKSKQSTAIIVKGKGAIAVGCVCRPSTSKEPDVKQKVSTDELF